MEASRLSKSMPWQLAGWVSEPDRGCRGINKGLVRATGEVVVWLNSDDLYYPDAIEAAVEALDANPQSSSVFSDVESIDEAGKPFRPHALRALGLGGFDALHHRAAGFHPASVPSANRACSTRAIITCSTITCGCG